VVRSSVFRQRNFVPGCSQNASENCPYCNSLQHPVLSFSE
jgi:hypothetical protein